ncbi:hypothetical protein L288_08855 [Sphingobium quisquiliarum P25]|uniref:DUF4142 domain-containing protein n=1 Tax=Sphingobium quisquiliarum P25 TaxID=1329909 RepID=T0IEN1_9SPHN|nr:DUF4142 domain-containing protein [Sphingobium quisquiliarum]EQB08124.1 hypothetical protein L288_08855 [Sphingobium quisquiliarum P25]EZP73945.1 Membrane protein [Sphingomonas paucimobilis]
MSVNRSLICAAMVLAPLAACNQTSGVSGQDELANGSATVARHYEGPKPEGVSSPNDAVTTTFYIPQAAIGDMYEIQSSELALVRARAPEVKAFARQMIEDHKKTSAALRQFVADNPVNIAIPKNMDARRNAMLSNLKSAGDAEFDAQYIGQQAAAHQEAFNLHSSYASRGDYAALKTLAQSTAKIVGHHREEAAALDARFGTPANKAKSGT